MVFPCCLGKVACVASTCSHCWSVARGEAIGGAQARRNRKHPSALRACEPRVSPSPRSQGFQLPSATLRGPCRSQAAPRPHPFVLAGLLLTPACRLDVFGFARTKQHKRNAVTPMLQDDEWAKCPDEDTPGSGRNRRFRALGPAKRATAGPELRQTSRIHHGDH